MTEPEEHKDILQRLDEVRGFLLLEWERAMAEGWDAREDHIYHLLDTLDDVADWLVVFSFAGQSITLGQLRALAALSPPNERGKDEPGRNPTPRRSIPGRTSRKRRPDGKIG